MGDRDFRRYDIAKRVADAAVGTVGLVVTLPLQAGVALVVLAAHGRPVLYRQPRPGKDGRIFNLIKFRSMRHPDERHLTDEERVTRVGRFIRGASLDELPTLWNVVKGEMSLVGPRPLRVEYLPYYSPEQARRHEVRPGVTGLAQVRGRNRLSWEEKFVLDVEYVDSRSFALDLRILWETVSVVLRRQGIAGEGHATVAAFKDAVCEP